MNKLAIFLFLYMGLLIPVTLDAQENTVEARVELSVQAQDTYWAGQQITVNLDLKTTGFSFANTLFNLPAINQAFLVQTDTTTIKLTERLEGKQWQVIRYPLALFAQVGGALEIPPIAVSFSSSAGFGSEPREFEFQTDLLQLMISLPPSVKDGELVTSTTSMQLDYTWQGQPDDARPGDAFTLTVKRSARDISAMLMPPLPVYRAEGLAAYPQTPELEDVSERGNLVGKRTDTIIWVAESAGTYEIPGIRFRWWDPSRQALEEQDVPGVNIKIPASQNDRSSPADGDEGLFGRPYQYALVVLVIIGLTVILRGRRVRTSGLETIDETLAFRKLKNACEQNRAAEAYMSLHTWLKLILPAAGNASLVEFARSIGDSQLETESQKLQEILVEGSGEWEGNRLITTLKRTRINVKKLKLAAPGSYLVELNP